MLQNCLAVGTGGFLGAVCRYLAGFIPVIQRETFPLPTLLINIAGAFLIGVVMALGEKHEAMNPQLLLFLRVGVCGGFTTFSTFSAEGLHLLESGKPGFFALYAILSVALCLAGVALGRTLVS